MGLKPILDARPADPLVDAVFDVRTGYHVITKPAGHFDNHPEGEGNPAIFSIIRCRRSQLPQCWGERSTEEVIEHVRDDMWIIHDPRANAADDFLVRRAERPTPEGLTEHVPLKKLDVGAHIANRSKAGGAKLVNVYGPDALRLVGGGSREDALREIARFDTRENAVLTVGTAKTHATIGGAVAASASGDIIECYTTAADTYAESVDVVGKQLEIVGLVANQGLTISSGAASGVLLDNASMILNFEVVGTGAAGINTQSARCWAIRCKVHGYTDGVIIANMGHAVNCIAYDCTDGFEAGNSANQAGTHCTAVDNTNGFRGASLDGAWVLCLACDNGTDFASPNAGDSMLNCSSDATAPGGGSSVSTFTNADFTDYAFDDFTLGTTTTAAKLDGYPATADDIGSNTRKNSAAGANEVYAGASDPDPPSYPGIIDPIIDGDATKAYVNGVQT